MNKKRCKPDSTNITFIYFLERDGDAVRTIVVYSNAGVCVVQVLYFQLFNEGCLSDFKASLSGSGRKFYKYCNFTHVFTVSDILTSKCL